MLFFYVIRERWPKMWASWPPWGLRLPQLLLYTELLFVLGHILGQKREEECDTQWGPKFLLIFYLGMYKLMNTRWKIIPQISHQLVLAFLCNTFRLYKKIPNYKIIGAKELWSNACNCWISKPNHNFFSCNNTNFLCKLRNEFGFFRTYNKAS